jgi:hypothetical protein
MYNTQNYWCFWQCPLSGILKTRGHNVSVTEVSLFYGAQQSRCLPPHLKTEMDPVSKTMCTRCWTKSKNLVILSTNCVSTTHFMRIHLQNTTLAWWSEGVRACTCWMWYRQSDCSWRVFQTRGTPIPSAAEILHTLVPGSSSTLLNTQTSILGVWTDQGLLQSNAHGAKGPDLLNCWWNLMNNLWDGILHCGYCSV